MKIYHIIWSGNLGGAERSIYNLIRSTRKDSKQCEAIICSRNSGYFADKIKTDGFPVLNLGLKKQREIFKIYRGIKKIPYGKYIFHFHSAEPLIALILLIRFRNSTFFYTHRSGYHNFGIKKKFIFIIWGFLLRYFDEITSISENARAFLCDKLKIRKKINVVMNGIEPADFLTVKEEIKSKIDFGIDNKFVIGTAANIRKLKRLEIVIDATSELKNSGVAFIIFGNGPELDYYKDYVSRKKLTDYIIFAGKKKDLFNYYGIIDLFILPSGKTEGFGNVVLEAMLFAVPVLIFNDLESIRPYFIEEEEIFVSLNSSSELSKRIRNLMHTRERLDYVGQKGRDAVLNRYTMENTYNGYKELYDKYM